MKHRNQSAAYAARILLVEDDSTLSMIVSETLQRDGFVVMTAGDGEDGLCLLYTSDAADE